MSPKSLTLPALLCLGLAAVRWGGRPPAYYAQLDPVRPRPGQTVAVRLPGLPSWHRARGRFAGTEIPFYPGPDGVLQALVPVPGDAQDARDLELEVSALGAWSSSLRVELEPGDFPQQELRLAAEKTALFTRPATADATLLIRRTIKRESPQKLWSGAFTRPLPGRVSTVYGARRTLNGSIRYFHKGLDLAGAYGEAVRAANAGRVELAGTFPLQGNFVLVDHGQGVKSAYQHMEKILVREGQRVEKGTAVGQVGSTGLASGPHLHWSVYVHGVAVDPDDWILRRF